MNTLITSDRECHLPSSLIGPPPGIQLRCIEHNFPGLAAGRVFHSSSKTQSRNPCNSFLKKRGKSIKHLASDLILFEHQEVYNSYMPHNNPINMGLELNVDVSKCQVEVKKQDQVSLQRNLALQ